MPACSIRATISSASDDVVAASTDPTSTTASTISSTRFLLCRSASRPINGGRRGGEQIRGDRPADSDGGTVELVGDDAEHRNDRGLQDGHGQDDDAQPDDQCPGLSKRLLDRGSGARRFRLDHARLSDR